LENDRERRGRRRRHDYEFRTGGYDHESSLGDDEDSELDNVSWVSLNSNDPLNLEDFSVA
jgi:hypothetical protein